MIQKYHETITLAKKDVETKEDFFQRISKQLELLLEEDYVAVVRYDEPGLGIVVIEFEHDNNLDDWGCTRPMWVTPEEAEKIVCMRENNCNRENVRNNE